MKGGLSDEEETELPPRLYHRRLVGSFSFSSSSSSAMAAVAAAAAALCFLAGGELSMTSLSGMEARRAVSSGSPYSVSEGMDGGGGFGVGSGVRP